MTNDPQPGDGADGGRSTDEATRITRIVLLAVILVLVGGLALLLVLGPSDDESPRDAVGDFDRSPVSIRGDEDAADTTTSSVASETTQAPETTAAAPVPPGAPPAPAPPPRSSPSPSPAPSPAAPARPASLEVFWAADTGGRLAVRAGQTAQISIRNSGGSDGSWALNATGPVRVDGRTGISGQISPGQVIIVNVTLDPNDLPDEEEAETIRFDTPDGGSRTIDVRVLP
jgi:hypothetical protein